MSIMIFIQRNSNKKQKTWTSLNEEQEDWVVQQQNFISLALKRKILIQREETRSKSWNVIIAGNFMQKTRLQQVHALCIFRTKV